MRVAGVAVLILLPVVVLLIVWRRIRWKERSMSAFYWDVERSIVAAGFEPMGKGKYRREGGGFKFDLSTNPLFARGFTLRLAAYSSTLHEFELRSGRPVPEEFKAFTPLLERWETAGKMYTECYAAGVVSQPPRTEDVQALAEISTLPLSKIWKPGILTIREGFEKDVPQWHWRHDQRPKLPAGVHRFCVSGWTGGPLLNPPLIRLFTELAAGSPMFYLSDAEDLSFLELAFPRRDIAFGGATVELKNPLLPVAADLHTDGGFFGGLLAAKDRPPGFEQEGMPKRLFHDAAIEALGKCLFYARRLWDDEFSWYSGEYEILSARPLPVRQTLAKIASELGAQVMEIDRRFHKRLVKPLEY